jgi:hypothetical protein
MQYSRVHAHAPLAAAINAIVCGVDEEVGNLGLVALAEVD